MDTLKWSALAALLSCSGVAHAQTAPSEDRRPLVALSYAMGVPARELRKELDQTSFEGFEYSVIVPLHAGWHFGVAANYNRFYESDGRRTYEKDNLALTGTYYRSLTTASLSIVDRYYLMEPDRPFRIYGGLRMGISFGDASRRVVDLADDRSPLGFLLAPEAGLSLRLCSWLDLAFGYQFVFTTSSFGRTDKVTFHNLQLGPQLHY